MELQTRYETFKGEGLKTAAEVALASLARVQRGREFIERYAFGDEGRIENPMLHTTVAGIEFENPVLFGAGWDKKGRAVRGLYELGFAGGDVGTVLVHPQEGNPKPRLWTINADHSVAINRMGFNSPGMGRVDRYLKAVSPLSFPIGINVGKNKDMPLTKAAEAHATVIRFLYDYGSYFVLGISSPNTEDLRQLQGKAFLRDNIQAAHEAMEGRGSRRPLFIKIDAERSKPELDDMIEVVLEEGASGFIATNTYMGNDLKAKYGERWGKEAGGLSGADTAYRILSTGVIKYIYEHAGDTLEIIGAGGVDSSRTALEKMKAGASAVQIVTAIRPSKGKVAPRTNKGLLMEMYSDGVKNIQEYIGVDTKRGVKAA